jgi:hypothetical protein
MGERFVSSAEMMISGWRTGRPFSRKGGMGVQAPKHNGLTALQTKVLRTVIAMVEAGDDLRLVPLARRVGFDPDRLRTVVGVLRQLRLRKCVEWLPGNYETLRATPEGKNLARLEPAPTRDVRRALERKSRKRLKPEGDELDAEEESPDEGQDVAAEDDDGPDDPPPAMVRKLSRTLTGTYGKARIRLLDLRRELVTQLSCIDKLLGVIPR